MVNEYMSAEAAEASSPYASSAPEGSSTWYTQEIAGREAAAMASTESTPLSSGGGTTAFYQDPRTGDMYANKAQFLSQNPTGVSVPVWSTPGVAVKTPTGEVFQSRYSQYWMDPAYTGPEPSIEEKSFYSDAGVARDFAAALLEQYGTTAAPVVQQKAGVYRSPSTPAACTFQQQIEDLTGGTSDVLGAGIDWLKDNLLIVVIVIAGIFVLPRLADAALPARRR